MTREPMSEQELDATLAEVGERLAYPRPTRLADAVRARLREPRADRWWDALRSPRYAFAPIVATLAVLALVVVLAVPDARAAAIEFLHLRGIDIFRAPAIAAPTSPCSLPPMRAWARPTRSTAERVPTGRTMWSRSYTRVAPASPCRARPA